MQRRTAQKEMVNKRESHQQQQQKKPSQTVSGDGVKKNENEEAATSSSTTATSNVPSDVYEFVSTPKHSSCSSGDENPGKNSDKSSDEKSGTDSDTPSAIAQQKRALGNEQQSQEHVDDNSTSADDDMKRKKRKDSDVTSKDNNKIVPTTTANTGTNRVTSRVGQKPPGPASKTMGLMNKGVNLTSTTEQCASPKMPTKSPESDHNEMSLVEDGKVGDGLKVPPLKIVIPPHNNSSASSTSSSDNQDQHPVANQRTNKNSSTTRTHPGLPYIVASSNSNDGISEKDPITSTTATTPAVTGARCQSPSADSNKSTDDGSTTTTATSAAKSSKSKELRVLRSSQRSGKDGKDDRGSNNSSPQLPVSSTPSPAAQGTDQMTTNETENQQNISAAPAINNSVTSSTSTNQNTSQTTQQQQQQQQQQTPATQSTSNELHPRKRKIKTSSKDSSSSSSVATSSTSTDIKDTIVKDEKGDSIHPHDQPFTNCYQMYIDLRKQIEQRHRSLHTVEPRPLKGFKDYLMNRRTYLLHGKNSTDPNIIIPPLMPPQMKEIFIEQEKERHKLKMRHSVEKEKLVLSKEQEILRVHCKAAQMAANQPQPFSVCTVLKDIEVYNVITPEQEEKYNSNRECRSLGRSFFKALTELDDKWEKIKEAMIIRHTNEAESLHAVQKMDWGWKMKELALCEYKSNPEIEELHVPMVDVTDDYTTPAS